jgi:outer membrane murein-binding lipoprotein Lpp
MNLEVIPTLIHILATVYAVIAASFALRGLAFHSNRALKRRITELEADLDKMSAWYTKLNANVASIRQSMNQTKKKEATNGELDFHESSDENPETWKRRMRVKLAAGQLKHQ